jgi:hypothetical protein
VPADFLTHQKASLRLIPIVRSNALTSRSSAEARIAKTVKNRVHLDLRPHLGDDQTAEAARLRALGATDVDVGQATCRGRSSPAPEGNEFRVLTPR